MTAVKYVGGLIRGTNAERIALSTTNLRAGWLFVCSDTLDIYYWTGSAWTVITNATGEANTASNVGAGQGVWKAKTGVDLSFRSLTATSSKIALANNTNDIGIDVTEANLALANISGTLAIGKGGTGQTTAVAGFDALSAMTTAGDTQYGGASGTRTRLAIGTANQLLRTNSGATAPEWASTLSGLTLTAPVISTISNTGTLTLPTSTDTLVGKATTDVFTNKTLTSPAINTPIIKYTDVTKVTGDSPYTIAAGDDVIRADASSGALTVTLPTAVGITGQKYTIKRIDILASSVLVTIATTSSQTIDAAAAHYLWPAEFVQVESDGANWQVINRTSPGPYTYYALKGSSGNRRIMACNQGAFSATSTFATSSTPPLLNTLFALPLILYKTTKCDLISFRDTTSSTAGNSRLGLYRDSGNCYPGALIYDSGAIVTTGTAGLKDATITSGLQVLSTGLYWLAYEADTNTGQIQVITANAGVGPCLFESTTFNAPVYGYSVAHTFGALPDPYTAGATLLQSAPTAANAVPALGLRPL